MWLTIYTKIGRYYEIKENERNSRKTEGIYYQGNTPSMVGRYAMHVARIYLIVLSGVSVSSHQYCLLQAY